MNQGILESESLKLLHFTMENHSQQQSYKPDQSKVSVAHIEIENDEKRVAAHITGLTEGHLDTRITGNPTESETYK